MPVGLVPSSMTWMTLNPRYAYIRNFSRLLSITGAHHAEKTGNRHNRRYHSHWLGTSACTAAAHCIIGVAYLLFT